LVEAPRDPAPADANPRRDALLWQHPVIEADPIVSIANFCTKRLDQEDFELGIGRSSIIERA
jgi:hypothetical protein